MVQTARWACTGTNSPLQDFGTEMGGGGGGGYSGVDLYSEYYGSHEKSAVVSLPCSQCRLNMTESSIE